MSIASWTSPRASGSTLPISRAISCARSSFCSARSAPNRKRISPPFGAGTRRLGLEASPWNPRSPAIAGLALAAGHPLRSAVGAGAAVDDDGHVRVVLVVLDHLVVELVFELPRDHAVDHVLSVSPVLQPSDF